MNVQLLNLLEPRQDHMYLASSLDRDPDRGGDWFGLRPAPARRKRILLMPGESHTMVELGGSGMITHLWFTTLLPLNQHALRGVRLRFYWDGEAQPSVECPLGDFFGAPFGGYRDYISAPLSLTSGGFNSLWPMPFSNGARLEVVNDSPAIVDPLFYQVTYRVSEGAPGSALRFHAHWRRQNPTQPGRPYTLVQAEGRGHYVGCQLFMQNRTWWLRPPLASMIFPNGFGLGMLEGWESAYVDGEKTPSLRGTGTEDHFGAAWYFAGGEFSAPDHGCTLRQFLAGRVAAYRFYLENPIPFERSLRVEIEHGYENQVEGDYASVAYWYQEEPHAPSPALPPSLARRPDPPVRNWLQSALLLGPPLLALGGVIRSRKKRKSRG